MPSLADHPRHVPGATLVRHLINVIGEIGCVAANE